MHGATGNVYTGLHEFEDMSFLLHALRREDLFIDVGANVGVYSVLASGAAGARTAAFEPVPQTFDQLLDNIHINRISELVSCNNKCIGAAKGEVYFTSGEDTTNHVVEQGNEKSGIRVSVTTLDEEIRSLPLCAWMKIDVEGYEKNVLDGAGNLLKSEQLKGIIIELNGSGRRYGFNDADVDQLLKKNGFIRVTYSPLQRRIDEAESFYPHGNNIYIRSVNLVKERVKEAPPYSIRQITI
jgi:FkbM family methyltransferase